MSALYQTNKLKKLDETKGVTRCRKSKTKNNTMVKRKKDKMTKNDLQNSTEKTKDRVTRTPQKIGGELGCSGKVSSSCSTSGARCVTLVKSR